MSHSEPEGFADRLRETAKDGLRLAGLIVGFIILGLIGAAILGPGNALMGWMAALIFAFVFITDHL